MLKDDYEWPIGKGLLKILVDRGYTKKEIAEEFDKSLSQVEKLFYKYDVKSINTPSSEFKMFAKKWTMIIRKNNVNKRQKQRQEEYEKLCAAAD